MDPVALPERPAPGTQAHGADASAPDRAVPRPAARPYRRAGDLPC